MDYSVERVLQERNSVKTELAVWQGRKIVVKTLCVKTTDHDTLRLFEREGQTLENIAHPNIPKIIRSWTHETPDGSIEFKIAQEFIAGKNLYLRIKNGRRFHSNEIVDIGHKIADVLIYLHQLNPPIVHRDIKPSNIILRDDSEIFLVDFGAVTGSSANGETVVGTYGYMPPEQFEGHAKPSSDIYALGMTLLTLITHKQPWEYPEGGPRQALLELDVPSNLKSALSSFCELEESKRPQNGEEAKQCLGQRGKIRKSSSSSIKYASNYQRFNKSEERASTLPKSPQEALEQKHTRFFSNTWSAIGDFVSAMFGISGMLTAGAFVAMLIYYVFTISTQEEMCEKGDKESCFAIGYEYNSGTNNDRSVDRSMAASYWERSCELGYGKACGSVGYLYETGAGVETNITQALEFYEQGCDLNDALSCSNRGVYYLNGKNSEKNYLKARTVFIKACEMNELGACNDLGVLYRDGLGMTKDTEKAKKLFQKSCNQGFQLACRNRDEIGP